MADNIRSIPSVADGLKPGQRKVIWGVFKRKLKKEIKVYMTIIDNGTLLILYRLHNLLATFLNTQPITTANRA
jgi:hypothetical protein